MLGHLFSTQSRLTRSGWLMSIIILAICCIAFGMLGGALAGNRGSAIFSFLFLWCAGCMSIRRLHDRGLSGWRLLFFLIPVVGWFWLLFALLVAGTEGDNQYGADPRLRLDYLRVQIQQR
jgi:uncharacterized membrane protein YhaH (DUF805 family)